MLNKKVMKLNRKEEIKAILKYTLNKMKTEIGGDCNSDNLDILVSTSTDVLDLSKSINSYLLELEEINKSEAFE